MNSLRASGLVLAAGLGTRISALSRHRPKPLLPVGLTTPLAHATAQLRSAGVDRVVANAAHLAHQIERAGKPCGVEVVVERDGPLGTAGGIAACRDALGLSDAAPPDAIVAWNGDIFATVDVRALLAPLADDPRTLAALAVFGVTEPGVGNVGLDDDDRVVRIRARSFGKETKSAFFAAIHALSSMLARTAPARGDVFDEVYFPAMARGEVVRAIAIDAGSSTRVPWHDIGDLASYLAANLAQIDGKSLVAADAIVARDAHLDRVVVGAGARVARGVVLRECIVWPAAHVGRSVARGVVVDDATIVRLDPQS
jgi:NDP-sugar pyrophosphorylase family protein